VIYLIKQTKMHLQFCDFHLPLLRCVFFYNSYFNFCLSSVLLYFSGPQGSWSVCCLNLKVVFRSCARGVAWHLALQLMNSFNKIEADIFPFRLASLRAFPFIVLIPIHRWCNVACRLSCQYCNILFWKPKLIKCRLIC